MLETMFADVRVWTCLMNLQPGILTWRCNAVWVPTPEQEEDPLEEEKPGYPGSQNGGSEVTVH